MLVGIGLISYSVYLWHWPLLTLLRYGYGDVGAAGDAAVFALTILLGYLSYRVVELPARHAKGGAARVIATQYLLPASAIGALALAFIYADRVLPALKQTTYRVQLATIEDASRPASAYPYVCQRQLLTPADAKDPRCIIGGDSSVEPDVVLWGDSNAAHYVGMLGTFAEEAGFRFRNIELGTCPPVFSDPKRFVDAKREHDCAASLPVVRDVIDRATTVVISASWTYYAGLSPTFVEAFHSTVRELTAAHKHVILIGKAPVLPSFDRRCRQKALTFPLKRCPAIRLPMLEFVAQANDALKHFAEATPNVEYFDVNAFLCPNGLCSSHDREGQLQYYDPSHLSLAGSWKLGAFIVRTAGVPPLLSRLGESPKHGQRQAR